MTPVRIACVRYLNTIPLIHGLDKLAAVSLLPTVPARIADMVRSGEADAGLVSVIDAMRPESPRLALLPVGMIGCDGPTLTVRLFSRVPLDRIRRIHADTDSHTSVVLCRILLRQLHGIDPAVADFDAHERVEVGRGSAEAAPLSLDEAWPETVLLIGDKVVVDAPPEHRYPHQLDLGDAWKRLTGLPFVYAVWACREDQAGSREVRTAAAILDRQRRHNATRLDWIVSHHASEHRWPPALAAEYLGSRLRFEVGPREREAVARFGAEAGATGEVTWVDLRKATHQQMSKEANGAEMAAGA
jgi:chorismate dehydratase